MVGRVAWWQYFVLAGLLAPGASCGSDAGDEEAPNPASGGSSGAGAGNGGGPGSGGAAGAGAGGKGGGGPGVRCGSDTCETPGERCVSERSGGMLLGVSCVPTDEGYCTQGGGC